MPKRPYVLAALLLLFLTPTGAQQAITSPRQQFGSNIGDDYFLVNYSQMIEYWKKHRKPVNPSAASTEAPIAPNAGELAQDAVNHPGHALEADTRATLEPAFGLDLSSVRVHTDESAAASADALNARAFTIGEHVVFGAGEFAPHSAEGQALLAHELTHVAQQQGGGGALATGGSATVQSPPNVDFDTVTLPTTETGGAASTTSDAPASPDASRIAAAIRPGLDARPDVVPRDHPSEASARPIPAPCLHGPIALAASTSELPPSSEPSGTYKPVGAG